MTRNGPKAKPPKGLNKGLWFVPLGGSGEIGMNLNLYACDGQWIMVDLGVTFGDESIPGVDVVMPDPDFIVERKHQLIGLVLTHAHEDHLGAVAYLWPKLECPVYATPFAAEFLRRKLPETGLQNLLPLTEIPLGGNLSLGPFDIDFVSLTHSIPEPNALAIRTPYGLIMHTGDWKFDPDPLIGEATDFAALEAIGDEGVLAMVGDSTNVFSEGESGSEGDVRVALTELIGKLTGRVAVGCFASNLARLESIARAAEANDRHVALVGASLWRIVDAARKTGYLADDIVFYEAEDAAHLPNDKVLYICTGSQGEARAALNRIAFGSHRDVRLEEGDTVVFSSRVIPGNEKSIMKLQNELAKSGVKIITAKDAPIHVSGHPARDEMRRMYSMIRPHTAIPVHGEQLHMRAHAELAKECQVPQAVLVENGSAVRLAPGDPAVMGEVWSGRMSWEGDRAVSFWDPVLRDRKKIFYGGSVVVSLVLEEDGRLATDAQVSVLGILDPLADDGSSALAEEVEDAVERMKGKSRRDDGAVEEAVRRCIRRIFAGGQNGKPLVRVHIARI
ncbi:MAG: ribonuclease J [Rhodospirillaceae bacterium]|nr:ribonuclease J [Rhodospirillaceae bacterium]MBT5564136.1 ribonuclease J [Rhodospirillaceae bacterium]MBT6089931.1 ribonuclease J [Rhodospirillaceae bacterium]MBT7451161.1 ribonuclease J [Rhodospirillaceae bacterium]